MCGENGTDHNYLRDVYINEKMGWMVSWLAWMLRSHQTGRIVYMERLKISVALIK